MGPVIGERHPPIFATIPVRTRTGPSGAHAAGHVEWVDRPVDRSAAGAYLQGVPATPTNRFYPLPDGRMLTWSHCSMRNASGAVMVEEHAFGHLDGEPIPDLELTRILVEHGLL